jgi:hypothetical protein
MAPDHHGKGVFEAERGSDCDLVAGRVEAPNGKENSIGIAIERLFQDGGEGGAGVFDVGIDATGDERLVADVTAGEVEAALDLKVRSGFDLLGEQFAEDDLFGEVLGADHGMIGAGRGTTEEKEEEASDDGCNRVKCC